VKLRYILPFILSVLLHPAAFAQGSLTPSGPPGPTMQTLEQMGAKLDQANTAIGQTNGKVDAANTKLDSVSAASDKRVDVASLSGDSTHIFVIGASGSYYLSRNVLAGGTDGILISGSNATLDLNGFSLILSVGSNKKAITITGDNVTVRNGTIRGWGSGGSGIDAASVNDCRFEKLHILSSGAALKSGAASAVNDCVFDGNATGVSAGAASTLTNCVVTNSSSDGISVGPRSTITNCVAQLSGGHGITAQQCVVQNSYGQSTGSGSGILAETASNCIGAANSGTGISATAANNSKGVSASGTGLFATNAANCEGQSASSTGLYATNAMNCHGSLTGLGSGYGLQAFVASYSQGQAGGSGTGLSAVIAVACIGSTGGGGIPVSATNKYLMP
jgi:hypothetical protein